MIDFEKLGVFYLGRVVDPATGQTRDEPLLYDARDLVTHAVCVGMTGSGKTGLGITILEEAAIDGIPALVIDPKGDLGNLLLTFPELRPEDFRPWVDEAEAAREGLTPEASAARTAEVWRRGLGEWGEGPPRIARFRSAVDVTIFTPASNAGTPLSVVRSLAAPPTALVGDADALRDRVLGAVAGLLTLLGIEADPVQSREHILLATLVQKAWAAGRDLDLAALIREIQKPGFDKVGVLDLESFFPARERAELALKLNNVLAAPGFSAWLEGEPLDIQRLLWTAEGKPRISVVSIAHLGDNERLFIVTLLLNELVAWMRTQSGTTSLRALFYMDEVFGYFPPVANPPCKTALLTLLKQARAFGVGAVLCTQNPVDLDYKGLSNAGTWFLGRLQTERDKARVLDGLEGAAASNGSGLDRAATDRMLSGLGKRVFLMHNVHESAPVLFQTRWTLSYLRGPLTRTQIQTLMAPRKSASVSTPALPAAGAAAGSPETGPARPRGGDRPAVPAEAAEIFVAPRRSPGKGENFLYRPHLLALAHLHFVDGKAGVDSWETATFLAALADPIPDQLWEQAEILGAPPPDQQSAPATGARYAPLPAAALQPKSYETFRRRLAEHLYRNQVLKLWRCPELKLISKPGEPQGDFVARARQTFREKRDASVEVLRQRYAPKIVSLQDRLSRAEARMAQEQSQYQQQQVQTAISLGATVLGALFGRKTVSVGTIGRATTTARGVGRTMHEREDVGRAQESVDSLKAQLDDLNAQLEAEIALIGGGPGGDGLTTEELQVRPRKADISVEKVVLAWTPWRVSAAGTDEAAY